MTRVLIVDDEKSIRIPLCAFLNKEGYEADSAADAYVALEMITNVEYDIIVTDIIMPRMSGTDLLEKVRQKSKSVQVIIMTGEPTVDTAVKAVKSGADDYLIKPIAKYTLIKAVDHASQVKRLNDEKSLLEQQNELYQRSLEQLVKQKTVALQNAMESTICLLSTVVEIRDPYTAGHQRRVGNLAAAIASKLELDKNIVEYIRIIGYMHDIGKIAIPTEILCKPGKLNTFELQMIMNHPLNGYEMLLKVDLPSFIGEAVYQHHERCDGSGYPRGLRGEDIIIEAHIIMVADVVEAMTTHRPYRPALGLDSALKEIEQNAGSLYDPDVVLACLELFNKDDYVIDDTSKIFYPT